MRPPYENTVTFTYDPSGKRLTKRIESKGKKTKIFRFFYLGNTEIGCVDEKGVITELKIPSNPNNPEAPSIAIEIGKETYVPLYDLQGNITCLLDHQRRKVVETYRYSAYGEEVITSARLSMKVADAHNTAILDGIMLLKDAYAFVEKMGMDM